MGRDSTISAEEAGRILSRLHWQCWRADAPPLDVEPSELIAVLPNLIRLGSVGLVWPRLQGQLDRYGAIALALEDAFQAQVTHNQLCQRQIASAVSRLQAAGIEPLLIKGWAVSRLYPPPLVRPAGDIDLVVRHADFAQAKNILIGPGAEPITVGVDIHEDAHWPDGEVIDFTRFTSRINVGGVEVLVPGVEDHLRIQCLHFMGHGGWRSLWLCDIALLLESTPFNFEWDRLLRGKKHHVQWIETTMALAQQLVGAELENTAIDRFKIKVPEWLARDTRKRWGLAEPFPDRAIFEIAHDPSAILNTFRKRWPDPFLATIRCHAAFNELPRLPLQWAAYIKQIISFAVFEMPRQIRAYRKSKPF